MPDVLFYHMTTFPLERVLPDLLERSLSRGWRVVVQTDSAERVRYLADLLWTYKDDSFLPHGSAGDGHDGAQPIWISADDDNPNSAAVRFFVDGASGDNLSGYERAVFLFDGRDESAVSRAREDWKRQKEAGHAVTYWAQDENGRWEKKA